MFWQCLAVISTGQKKLKEAGIDYYVIGSLTENINNDGKPDGVYYEVDIINGKWKVKEHHIEIWVK